MKLTVESNGNGEFEITLNWNGKDYTEKWKENGSYCAYGIISQMEAEGINADGTIIDDVLSSIDNDEILEMAESEQIFFND